VGRRGDGSTDSLLLVVLAVLVVVLVATGVSGWVDGGWIYCIALTGGVSGVSGGVSSNRCEWVGRRGDGSTVLLLLVVLAVLVVVLAATGASGWVIGGIGLLYCSYWWGSRCRWVLQ